MLLALSRPAIAAKYPSYSPTILTATPWCKSLVAESSGIYELKHCENSDKENEWSDIDRLHCVGWQIVNGFVRDVG